MIFQKFSQNKKKKRRKTDATSLSNRSERLYECFFESEEAGRTVLLFNKEKQIRSKIEGGKKRLFPNIFSWELHHILGLCVSLVTDCHTAPVQLPACHHGLHFKILPHHPNKTLEDRRRQNIGWKERRKNLDARMKYHTRPCYSFLQREI